jgi:hypothetical protein
MSKIEDRKVRNVIPRALDRERYERREAGIGTSIT